MGTSPHNPSTPPPSRAQWKAQQQQWKRQARIQREAYRMQYRANSRHSLVGPLLLVGIGVVALLLTTHHIDGGHFWQWYGHWWPLILIGAGVILALESLAASGSSRVRLGGGAVLLGILLAFLGIAASYNRVNWSSVGQQFDLGNGVNLSQMFGTRHEARDQVQHALPANATVIIQNPQGDVSVSPGEKPASIDQLRLTLNKTVYSNSDSDAQRKMQGLEPLITSHDNTVVVHMPSSESQTADIAATLPAKVAIQVRAGHGDIAVNGRQASVDVNADHGDTTLSAISGQVRAVMHHGDFSANNIQGDLDLSGRMDDVSVSQVAGAAMLNGDFFGDVHLEKVHGPMHLHSSRTDCQAAQLGGSMSLDGDDLSINAATGPIAVTTHAKDVSLQRVTGDIKVQNSDGSVEVIALNPVGAINIDNRKGSVQVTLPGDAKFSVQATASDGEVHSDFKLSAQNGEDRGTISGVVGAGGPLIRIVAEKGDITLRKSE
ncbi:MAG TPA: DUF4097 family beta strand repeat-containing protein [Acidobacteriaceae bacterium]|nr:DUF4097 family beta strand repeat-containing protein [Acidobacteriaceae bacterium]